MATHSHRMGEHPTVKNCKAITVFYRNGILNAETFVQKCNHHSNSVLYHINAPKIFSVSTSKGDANSIICSDVCKQCQYFCLPLRFIQSNSKYTIEGQVGLNLSNVPTDWIGQLHIKSVQEKEFIMHYQSNNVCLSRV